MIYFYLFSLVADLDHPDWRVRRDAECALVKGLGECRVNLTGVLDGATTHEARWRARRVLDRYRDVGTPGFIPSECWWDLYTRVTGVRQEDVGWFFGAMPTPDIENAMKEQWVLDRFREGMSRIEVSELIASLRY